MDYRLFLALASALSLNGLSAWADSGVDALIESRGRLIFEDTFNRTESDDAKEELGRNWVTNSVKRAKGTKQADLVDGALRITMAPHANHGVSVRHDFPLTTEWCGSDSR